MGIEPIKLPGNIGTVIPAVSHANAPVIDLSIQAIRRVIGSIHRTHGFTGGLITLLTQHGKKFHLHVGIFPFPISFNADPVNGSSLSSLLFTGNTNVIFCVTSHHTSLASGTPVQVDDHFPFIG
jgi:hypothetical protein